MPADISVPDLGESITEATVAEWRVGTDEPFPGGALLVELETDKVTQEILAPSPGVLREIRANAGDVVEVGSVLAVMEELSPGQLQELEGKSDLPGPAARTVEREALWGEKIVPPATKSSAEGTSAEALPAARRLLDEHGISPREIPGSGRGGRITKGDVLEHLKEREKGEDAIESGSPSGRTGSEEFARGERAVPLSPLRKRLAQRLLEVQQTAALLTTFNEVDMQAVIELRGRYREDFKKEHGVGLGFMSFFTRACVEALKAFPALNAEIRGEDLIYKDYIHIGVAVGGPRGLVVPVIQNADRLSFPQIEAEIARLAGKVQDNTLTLEELQGGTFTISNGGIYGSMLSTPIVNPPQSGILGMHNIVRRPVVVDEQIVIRPVMYIALTYDHRIVDGREAVGFLMRIRQCIEDPRRMLIGI